MIKVLIVEDSPVVRELMVEILDSDSELQVIGEAINGKQGVEMAKRKKPDVITMDIVMPVMNGIDATARIMETAPVPIIIVSASFNRDELHTTFQAIEAGALTVVEKPRGPTDPDFEDDCRALVEMVKTMADVKLVRRRPGYRNGTPRNTSAAGTPLRKESRLAAGSSVRMNGDVRIVALGASTGGPAALYQILGRLDRDFPIPLVLVQHMADGFIRGMVDWLDLSVPLRVLLAANGERIRPGHAYFAPDGQHMHVSRDGRIVLNGGPPEQGVRPSANELFRSVASSYGKRAAGALLTGMGADGVEGLRQMAEAGAVTMAQDEQSSVVFGMPKMALQSGAASWELNPDQIADAMNGFADRIRRSP